MQIPTEYQRPLQQSICERYCIHANRPPGHVNPTLIVIVNRSVAVDAKNPVPSFTLNGNPSLEAGVPHFDVTVQISTTPAIKFVLNFVV